MKPYSKYIPSGIQWIGNIPEHWMSMPLKRLSDITLGKMLTPEDKGGYVFKPYLRAQNLQWFQPNVNDVNEMWFSENELNQYRIYRGDLLVSEGGEAGRTCIWNDEIPEVYFQNSVNRVKVNSDNLPKYFLYQFAMMGFCGHFNAIVNKVSIAHLTKEKLKETVFITPPLTEQTTITNFLDHKTAQIDNAITKKQQLIELLEEERKAIVNEAVTKGINKKIKLKSTGVDWLGEVPEHWQIKKIKHTSYVKGRVGWNGLRSDEFLDNGYSYLITGTDFENGLISWNTCYHIDKERYEEDPFIQLQENDLLITKDGTIGKTAVVKDLNGYACLNSGIFVVRPLNGFYITSFLYYILNSNVFTQFINFTSSGSTIQHLYQNVFNEFKFTVPPISEQKDIVNYIGKQTAKINNTISQISQEIELLKEYRQSLIFEAVTGKIKIEVQKN